MNRLLTAAAALATMSASNAFASEGGPIAGLNQGAMSSIVAIVVFVVVLAVLSAVVWPKIAGGLKDRENKIREAIEAAESAQAQAKAQLEQYNKALADARAEAQRMLETARTQQAQQAAEMKVKAEAELALMKGKAMADIEAAKKQALADIYQSAASIATQVASKVLQREVGTPDNLRLAQDAVSQLTGRNN